MSYNNPPPNQYPNQQYGGQGGQYDQSQGYGQQGQYNQQYQQSPPPQGQVGQVVDGQQQGGGDPNNPQDRGLITNLVVGGVLAYGATQLMNQHNQAQQSKPPQQSAPPQNYSQQGYGQGQGPPPPQQNNHYGAYAAGAVGLGAAAYGAHAYSQHQQQDQPQTCGASAATDVNLILNILQKAVVDQRITAFYPQGSLPPLAQRIASSGAINRIVQEWRLPLEIAMDLCKLALFDTWLYLDDSASVGYDEKGERLVEIKSIAGRVAFVAGLLDTDGINMRFMNSKVEGSRITSAAQAGEVIAKVKFNGSTPLGTALEDRIVKPEVLKPAAHNNLRKPVLIVIITDGEPNGESRSKLSHVIQHANKDLQKTRYGPDAVSYQLAQVGNDQKARAFLEEIDTNAEIGRLVDVTSNYKNEGDNMRKYGVNITPELWVSKLLLGAVDSAYDATDEGGSAAYANKLSYATSNPGNYRAFGLPPPAAPMNPSQPPPGAPNMGGGGYNQGYGYPQQQQQQGQYPPQNQNYGYNNQYQSRDGSSPQPPPPQQQGAPYGNQQYGNQPGQGPPGQNFGGGFPDSSQYGGFPNPGYGQNQGGGGYNPGGFYQS